MTSVIFECNYCNYKTNKKYNLNRHIHGKHNINIFNNANIDFNNTNNNFNNTNIDFNNTNIDFNNANNDFNNANNNTNNTNNTNICDKCGKSLSSKYYLNKHFEKCKGVINSLECFICHRIFSFSSAKAVHLKKCRIKNNSSNLSLVPIDNDNLNDSNLSLTSIYNDNSNLSLTQIENNNLTIVPITQINNNNINNTININLIYYDKEENKIIFDITHIKEDIVYKIVTRDDTDAFKYFCDKLFENKNNQLIVKKSLRDNYSKVHVGFNYWEKLLDEFIYPKLMSNISETMITYIDENKGKHRKTKIEYIMNYLHIMASNGYSYKNTNEYKKKYKNNIDMLKILFNSFL